MAIHVRVSMEAPSCRARCDFVRRHCNEPRNVESSRRRASKRSLISWASAEASRKKARNRLLSGGGASTTTEAALRGRRRSAATAAALAEGAAPRTSPQAVRSHAAAWLTGKGGAVLTLRGDAAETGRGGKAVAGPQTVERAAATVTSERGVEREPRRGAVSGLPRVANVAGSSEPPCEPPLPCEPTLTAAATEWGSVCLAPAPVRLEPWAAKLDVRGEGGAGLKRRQELAREPLLEAVLELGRSERPLGPDVAPSMGRWRPSAGSPSHNFI